MIRRRRAPIFAALAARYVSVTPLRLDLTHDAMMDAAWGRRFRSYFLTVRRSIALAQAIELERLLQHRRAAIGFGQAARAVTGRQQERKVALADDVDHREYLLAIEIDVENGEVEIGFLGAAPRLVERRRLGRHVMADIGEHIGQHHADHGFVFHDQHALFLRGSVMNTPHAGDQLRTTVDGAWAGLPKPIGLIFQQKSRLRRSDTNTPRNPKGNCGKRRVEAISRTNDVI